MAWVATDNFNSYSVGNLNTLNGGTGWSSGWAQSTGTISVENARAYEGANGISSAASAVALYRRALTSTVTAGTFAIAMQSTDTTSIFYTVLEDGSGNGRMYIKFDSDGNIKIFSNGSGTYVTLQAYVVDTWYLITIDFDNSAQPNLYRAKVNSGSYSSYYTVNSGTYTSISHVRLERESTAGDVYWDTIDSGQQNLTLTAGTGSFTLTGNATGLSKVKTMTASVGSFVLTGNDVTFAVTGTHWTTQSKNSATWTTQSKNSATWSTQSSNSATWTTQTYSSLIDSYATSNQSTNITLYSAQPVVGQTFTTSFTGVKLTSVQFYLKKSGSPTGTAIAQLYAMTDTFGSNGKPTGSVLATSDDFDVSTLTTSYALHSFTFSGANMYSLTGGSYYCIGLRYTGGDVSNQVIVGADSTSPTHNGNGYFSSNGTTYSSSSSDRVLYIYGTTTYTAETKNSATWSSQTKS